MLNVKYDFSSVHVEVEHPLADEIINWGKRQVPDEDIYVTQKDPTFGREDEIHITVLYGIHSDNPKKSIDLISNLGSIKGKLGKVNVFTNPIKFDVVMIEVVSNELCKLNEVLHNNITYTNKYGKYHPHITVAYVKKGKGWKYSGSSNWENKEFTCNFGVFSSKDGTKHKFTL
jgi:2'-5' RNA ligase